MSTIAEIQFPAVEFALAETLSDVPHLEFETVRVVAHDTDRVLPLVWAQTDDTDALDDALDDDPTVENVRLLADLTDERLYRMDWVGNVETIVHALLEHDGTVLNASGRADGWHLRILFPDRDSLSATHDFATDNDISFSLQSVADLSEGRGNQFALTEHQHQALLVAYEQGYYDIPQGVTTDDLAEEIGVSQQAVSQRLHRAYSNLIENTLVVGHAAATPDE
jgi:predicted DNA binding protein